MSLQSELTEEKRVETRPTTIEWLPVEAERLRVSRFVDRSFAHVDQSLRIRPEEILHLAYGHGPASNDTVISLSLHRSLPWLRVPVRVQSFTPSDDEHGAVISIRWEATRAPRAFPSMVADVSVLPRKPNEVELVLIGRYRPPLGIVGLILDRLIGRWVASTTAKNFLDHLADCIEHT